MQACNMHPGQGTEAQMRAALHAHILVWFLQREEKKDYAPLDAIPREAMGTKPCQRPRNQKVSPLATYQEDNCYHRVQMGRVLTEMVRPCTHMETDTEATMIIPSCVWRGWLEPSRQSFTFIAARRSIAFRIEVRAVFSSHGLVNPSNNIAATRNAWPVNADWNLMMLG